jgi:hypothetical protein
MYTDVGWTHHEEVIRALMDFLGASVTEGVIRKTVAR